MGFVPICLCPVMSAELYVMDTLYSYTRPDVHAEPCVTAITFFSPPLRVVLTEVFPAVPAPMDEIVRMSGSLFCTSIVSAVPDCECSRIPKGLEDFQ